MNIFHNRQFCSNFMYSSIKNTVFPEYVPRGMRKYDLSRVWATISFHDLFFMHNAVKAQIKERS